MAESKIDGYHLCLELLPDGSSVDFSPLVKRARRRETDWLEFKARCEPPPEGPSEGCNAADYRWHVARAVYSLANTCGGCLLLGVDDNGRPIGLEGCDPKGIIGREGMDAFLRHLGQTVFSPEKGWACEKAGRITPENPFPKHLVRLREGRLSGKVIVAVLVKPVPEGEDCLYLRESRNGRESSFLPVRDRGDVGRVRHISSIAEIKNWEKSRKTQSAELAVLLPKQKNDPTAWPQSRRQWIVLAAATLCAAVLGGWLLGPRVKELPPPDDEGGGMELARVSLGEEGRVEAVFTRAQPNEHGSADAVVPDSLVRNLAAMSAALAETHEEPGFLRRWFGGGGRSSPGVVLTNAVASLASEAISYGLFNLNTGELVEEGDEAEGPTEEVFRVEQEGLVAKVRGDFSTLVKVKAGNLEKQLREGLERAGVKVAQE